MFTASEQLRNRASGARGPSLPFQRTLMPDGGWRGASFHPPPRSLVLALLAKRAQFSSSGGPGHA
jgi:hypothetical protein